MQKAYLYTEDGNKKEVYLLDEGDLNSSENFKKKNWKEHLYMGYLVVGTIAFGLGIFLTLKRLNAKQ